ncbi:MAG: HAMP domain-containing histidine kinase [Anaerolineae bacterium]|nr:HAMP domain-containing histidine kinase [Anaerolineae bacterium]
MRPGRRGFPRRYPPHHIDRRFGFWKHFPPYAHAHHEHHPGWEAWRPIKNRFLLMRMARGFLGLTILFLGIMGGIFIIFRTIQGSKPLGQLVWMAGCAISLAFPLMVAGVAALIFREFGTPLSNIMAAADAVAEGDLDTRVPEGGPGEFGKLARSFNRMTTELARAEQQRRNLTADVAHELRTPLHIIQGNLEGVLDGVYEPTREHITATLDETRLLARLVSDLQTLSLAEAGQLPLHRQWVEAADLLADVATSFNGQAAEAGLTLRAEAAPDTGQMFVDADRLDQVLSNLVNNALHHTSRGGSITLAASPLDGGSGVCLTIQDTGSGIAPEDLPFVFDRFWRGDRSRARQSGTGSGLGLAIARQLVQAHGGQIAVESKPGQGTRFSIRLGKGN